MRQCLAQKDALIVARADRGGLRARWRRARAERWRPEEAREEAVPPTQPPARLPPRKRGTGGDDLWVRPPRVILGRSRRRTRTLSNAASILQALDPAILSVDLITDDRAGDICSVTVPHASYPIRLSGAAVARHLWVRLTEGRWRCQRYQILEQYLDNARQ